MPKPHPHSSKKNRRNKNHPPPRKKIQYMCSTTFGVVLKQNINILVIVFFSLPLPLSQDELIAMEEELLLIDPSLKDPLPGEAVDAGEDAGNQQIGAEQNAGDQQVSGAWTQLSDVEEERRDFLVRQLLQQPRLPISCMDHARLIVRLSYGGTAYRRVRQANAADEEEVPSILRMEHIVNTLPAWRSREPGGGERRGRRVRNEMVNAAKGN